MKINYPDFPGFEGIYLEDSFVLGIAENHDELIFEMEFVVLENHPSFTKPEKGESHCYVKGTLYFGKVNETLWKKRSLNTFKDADQEIDLGNIDTLFELDGRYHLEGDWGEIELVAEAPIVNLA